LRPSAAGRCRCWPPHRCSPWPSRPPSPRSPAGSSRAVPFFLFQCETDVITLTSLAEYFQEVQAPTKELALIKDAGHFAVFTQPDRFLAELLAQVRPLASQARPASIRVP
jgi:pimeloyl-ACP methyl ester carboxylesterase